MHFIMLSDDESLVLGECGDNNTYTLGLTECNEFDINQIFYFNLWIDEPLEPIDN
ncbi:hypothetical protein H8356DRAFT_1364102 [Neocallimastix lanati (nom. inval.)]|nr:hypothetical protein H8356DRAFT_1364102 [Neocallimastix sp. JGI-2020a]